jgi:hypothetical protein
LFVDLFLDADSAAPPQITLDLDATDDPLHGHQEGRFFHGCYDNYCYLPLYVFCGRHLLASKSRPANIDANAGSAKEVARIVARIRQRWPKVRILLRADSGFARDRLMTWCETNGVDFLFGLAKNSRLVEEIKSELAQVAEQSQKTGKPARRPQGLCLTNARQWEPQTPRRRLGRMDRGQGQAALCGHLAGARGARGPPPLREALLRTRRDRTGSRNASSTFMPIAPRPKRCAPTSCAWVRLDGLCAALRLALYRPGPHSVRLRLLRHHPPQALEDWCACSH